MPRVGLRRVDRIHCRALPTGSCPLAPRPDWLNALYPESVPRRRHASPKGQSLIRGPLMIDHIGFAVSNMERSKPFYGAALKPLGISIVMEVTAEQTGADAHAGFGKDDKAFFGIFAGGETEGGTHGALTAPTPADGDSFSRAALAAGGRDNGSPGLRHHYHPSHYGAFVLDPDGNNVEAVCRRPG